MKGKCPKCRSFAYIDSKCSSCGYKSNVRTSIDALYPDRIKPVLNTSKSKAVSNYGSTPSVFHVDPFYDNSSCHSSSSSDSCSSDSSSGGDF